MPGSSTSELNQQPQPAGLGARCSSLHYTTGRQTSLAQRIRCHDMQAVAVTAGNDHIRASHSGPTNTSRYSLGVMNLSNDESRSNGFSAGVRVWVVAQTCLYPLPARPTSCCNALGIRCTWESGGSVHNLQSRNVFGIAARLVAVRRVEHADGVTLGGGD
eukprot:365381-Chlamydomonas_euryale.AAC.26